jgi:hypothetical protein
VSALAQLGRQIPPHDAAALARQILTEPRFRMRVQATRPHTWLDTLRDWLGDRWNQLLNAFSQHLHVNGRVSIALGDVLIGAAILVLFVFGVRLLLGIVREDRAVTGVQAQALPAHADATELHAAAQRAARDGAYASAIALLFRATLAVLDVRGVLRDDPARTVNECRADVRAKARLFSVAFDRIARAFTAAVYAEDRVTQHQWIDAQEAYAALAAPHADVA